VEQSGGGEDSIRTGLFNGCSLSGESTHSRKFWGKKTGGSAAGFGGTEEHKGGRYFGGGNALVRFGDRKVIMKTNSRRHVQKSRERGIMDRNFRNPDGSGSLQSRRKRGAEVTQAMQRKRGESRCLF